MGKKNWLCKKANEDLVEELMDRFRYPRIIAELLVGRGIGPEDVDSFVRAPLSCLSDPYLLPGMEKAVERLWVAIAQKEPILIHGDYDTDGITSAALLSQVLEENHAIVETFLPHRFDDGYGLTPESLNKAIEGMEIPPKVLVTVDCGITSNDAVNEAIRLGIDTIITDHHEPSEEIPAAYAIINPKVYSDLKGLQVLSGVGTAFKLCHAFIKYGRQHELGGVSTNLQGVLDFVALGTVADIVPLLGENRILVKHGIQEMKNNQRPGIQALTEIARLRNSIKPMDITFKLAPRLNAAGRLGNATTALKLLKANDIDEAYKYANELEEMNTNRQQKEEEIYRDAISKIKSHHDPLTQYSLVVAGENWHQGVIGIVASRLARDFNRPSIVLTISGNEAQGSGRSIGPLNLVKILSECSPLLTRFGGHPMAVGLGLHRENIEAFAKKFEEVVRCSITPEELVHRLDIDCEADLDELIDPALYNYFDLLAPFGHGNPQPVLLVKSVSVERATGISNNRHIRGSFVNKNGTIVDFIAFNRSLDQIPQGIIDVVVIPGINDFYSMPKVQLQVIDWQPHKNLS